MPIRIHVRALILFISCFNTFSVTGGWIHTQVGDLEVYSQLKKKDTKALLDDLHYLREGLRQMFPNMEDMLDLDLQGKIRLFLIDDKNTYVESLPLYRGKPKPASGIFSPGPFYDLLWVDSRQHIEYVKKTLFHEFTHALLRKKEYIPLAIEEGLAVLFSDIVFEEDEMVLGTPNIERLRDLSIANFIPVDQLLMVHHGSKNYNHMGLVSDFYNESWILMHYITTGGANQEIAEAFWNSVSPTHPFTFYSSSVRPTPGELSDLHIKLRNYVWASNFKLVKIRIDDLEPAPELKFEKVSRAEIRSALAGIQRMVGRKDEAGEKLQKLVKKYSKSPEPFAELALLNLYGQNLPEAKTAAKQAHKNGGSEDLVQLIDEIASTQTTR